MIGPEHSSNVLFFPLDDFSGNFRSSSTGRVSFLRSLLLVVTPEEAIEFLL